MNFDFLESTISDHEFSQRLVAKLKSAYSGASAEDFALDPIQLRKFLDLLDFFEKAAKDLGGKIEAVDLDPLNPPTGLTASFVVFDLAGDDVQRFCDVIRNCSAISMDVTSDDKVCISCTIPKVFVPK